MADSQIESKTACALHLLFIRCGENLIDRIGSDGYQEVVHWFSSNAQTFLENLCTLQEPIQSVLASQINSKESVDNHYNAHCAYCKLEQQFDSESQAAITKGPSRQDSGESDTVNGLDIPTVIFNVPDGCSTQTEPFTSAPAALRCLFSDPRWLALLTGLIPAAFLAFDRVRLLVDIASVSTHSTGIIAEYRVSSVCSESKHESLNKEKGLASETRRAPAPGGCHVGSEDAARISPASFCKISPFHFLLDEQLRIVQVGQALGRVLRGLRLQQDSFSDRFVLVSPAALTATWSTLASLTASHPLPVTLRCARSRARQREGSEREVCGDAEKTPLARAHSHPTKGNLAMAQEDVILCGQLFLLVKSLQLLFIGSPNVSRVNQLTRQGLFLSDLPLHDATRELLLLNEQLQAESELASRLEVATRRLEEACLQQQEEKQLSDSLVYSILPPSVAQRLRNNQPIEAQKFKAISILFCGLCNFDALCSVLLPIELVNLLNTIYTRFDALADTARGVYKMETVGDKYMLVSGLPEKTKTHARDIAYAALDMLNVARDLRAADQQIQVRLGVHSGEVVAGVVGLKLPHYAVFGGTVCLASRMESKAEPSKICCSEFFYKTIEDMQCGTMFEFRDRGLLDIKGWSEPLRCYYLEGVQHA